MLKFLPSWLKGGIAILFYVIFTIVLAVPLFIWIALKFLIPIQIWRKICTHWLEGIASIWLHMCHITHDLMGKMQITIENMPKLNTQEWHLVIANHQSWVDIFVLTKIFHQKIPMFRFFIKRELLWIPVVGAAFWALDFPVMRRYSKEKLAKNPELRAKDAQTSIAACEKYMQSPVSIINFVEGTRLTEKKYQQQKSPYQCLLKPKAGGLSFVINAMQYHLNSLINVTIAYPQGVRGFWELLSGRIGKIKVHIETLPIVKELIGDYENDSHYKLQFQLWLNDVWQRKDERLKLMLKKDVAANNARPNQR